MAFPKAYSVGHGRATDGPGMDHSRFGRLVSCLKVRDTFGTHSPLEKVRRALIPLCAAMPEEGLEPPTRGL